MSPIHNNSIQSDYICTEISPTQTKCEVIYPEGLPEVTLVVWSVALVAIAFFVYRTCRTNRWR